MPHPFNHPWEVAKRLLTAGLLTAACLLISTGCGPWSLSDAEGDWSMQYHLSLDECNDARALRETSQLVVVTEDTFWWHLLDHGYETSDSKLPCTLVGQDFECSSSQPDMGTSSGTSLTGTFSDDFSEVSGDYASYFSVMGSSSGCDSQGTFEGEID